MIPDASAFELGPVGGGGPALLCLHGLTGTPYDVRPPAAVYEELGFACLGPLLPGHGVTWKELARMSRSDWVTCATEHFDRLASTHSRVYVVGLSLGGVLALRVAQLRPVESALLLATPIDLGVWRRWAAPIVSWFRPSIPKTPGIRDSAARERHPGLRRMPLRAVSELIRLQAEVESELERIRAPLRLLYSRSDPTVSVGDAERILRGATRTTGTVDYLDRSSHVITVDLERDQVERWWVRALEELEKGRS